MSKRMSNKKVKQMICDVHNIIYKDKAFFSGVTFGRMNYHYDHSVDEMSFGVILFRIPRSLTANQLKGISNG